MNDKHFSIKARLKSFAYAFNGIKALIKNEHNARIHLFATICVIPAGFFFDLPAGEWIAIIFAIGFVFSAEAVNSAIEYLADFVSPGRHELIKQAKDIAAAAVLFSALTAAIVGLIIFLPKIINLI